MNNTKTQYIVDRQQMDEYLKRRFTSMAIKFSIMMIFVLSMLSFNVYNLQGPDGLWSFLFSVPLMIGAFLFGIKWWHSRLGKLADAGFILKADSIAQIIGNQVEKDIRFSEIVVFSRRKFGTTIVKGNWWTKIDYYRPQRTIDQLDNPALIFIPSITTNYSELIELIAQQRHLNRAR